MELKLGVIIFITVSLHVQATTSVEFSFYSQQNLFNFVKRLTMLYYPFSNSTIETMLGTITEIKNTLNEAADNGINLSDPSAKLEWFYHFQSEKDKNAIGSVMEHCESLNVLFNTTFLSLLDDFTSESTKYQCFNISEDVNENIFFSHSYTSLMEIPRIIFYEVDSNNTTLIQRMVKEMNIDYYRCKSIENHQLLLSTFYQYVMKAQLQAVTMIISIHKLMAIKKGISSDKAVGEIENSCLLKWNFFLKKMKYSLHELSTDIFNCGPVTSEAFLSEVHMIDLLPIHSHFSLNKVIIKIGLQVSSSMLTLRIVEAPIRPYGEIVNDTRKHQLIPSNNINYWNPFDEYDEDSDSKSDESCPTVANISKGFWENIKFLNTTVPEGCVVVGAKIEMLYVHMIQMRLIYLRLQYANYNHTDGTIDPKNVQFTKLWKNDDPELTKLLRTKAIDGSFKKDIEIPDTDELGNQKIEGLPNDFRIRMRHEQYINYRTDCDVLSPKSLKPLTGLSFWKSNHQNKNIYYLSLKASPYDLSQNIDV